MKAVRRRPTLIVCAEVFEPATLNLIWRRLPRRPLQVTANADSSTTARLSAASARIMQRVLMILRHQVQSNASAKLDSSVHTATANPVLLTLEIQTAVRLASLVPNALKVNGSLRMQQTCLTPFAGHFRNVVNCTTNRLRRHLPRTESALGSWQSALPAKLK